MTKVTASCYDLADEGTPCVLWLEDTNFSNGRKRSGDPEGQKDVCCAGYLPFVPPDPLFTLPILPFAPWVSSVVTTSEILLAFWFLIGLANEENRQEIGGYRREESRVNVCILSAFFRQVCLKLDVTLDTTSVYLSRSGFLSGWSLNHNTPFWVSSDCSLPSSFSLGMVTTALLQAPGCRAMHYIFLHPAHDFVNSPFAKPALNYLSSVCLLFYVATLIYNTPL